MSEIDEIRARHERDYPNRNWQEEVDDVSYLLKRNTELQAEVARLKERNSCAACQDENTRLVSENASLSANFNGACHKRDQWKARAEAAEAKLRAVGELPGKWRDADLNKRYPTDTPSVDDCADELDALLKEGAL